MSTYLEAKAHRDALQATVQATSDALRSRSGGGPMGMTPGHVRSTPEWQTARRAYDLAFQRLRNFNEHFVKQYAKEIRAERRMRGR